jgi:hypothetical protein
MFLKDQAWTTNAELRTYAWTSHEPGSPGRTGRSIPATEAGTGAPVAAAQPTAEMDDISESFFADGERQEALGWFHDASGPYRGSGPAYGTHRKPG